MTDLLPTTHRALQHRLATAQVDGRAPSMAAGIVRDGVLAWADGVGSVDGEPPTRDTQYRVGSLTKTFVAVLVMRLRDEARIDLADRLGEHVPGTAIGQVRVAELLAHTAGLASETPPPWWERTPGELRPSLADALGDDPMRHPAGRRFHYSNPGFAALGTLVQSLRGAPWGDVLQREVLAPLGMPRTTLLPQPPHARGFAVHPWADVLLPEPATDTGVMAPAGQLWSTVNDLARFATFLLDGHDEVLAADTLEEMRAPASGPQDEAWDGTYGLGLQLVRLNGRRLFGHTGSMPGFLAALWVDAEAGLGAVGFANATHGVPVGVVCGDLLNIVATQEPRIPAAWEPLPEVDPDLLALTGPWYWGANPFALRLRAGRGLELTPVVAQGRASRFRASGEGSWIGLDGYYLG